MFNFHPERLDQDCLIGRGACGEVFPYQKHPGDLKWVVKQIIARNTEELLECLPEIVLGFSCDHPCIVPVKGYYVQPTEPKGKMHSVYLKLPRMKGNLADEIKRRKREDSYFSEGELVKHFYALVSAVDYLHNKKIFHGDIKPQTILLNDQGDVKLSGLGSVQSVYNEELPPKVTSTISYTAPELIQREYVPKKDSHDRGESWSLGLTVLEMCMLEQRLINPYGSVQDIEDRLQKIRKKAGERYGDEFLDCIFDLLKIDPAERFKVSATKRKLEENFREILVRCF